MGYALQIPSVPLPHVRPMGPQFPPRLFVPDGVWVSFEGGLSLDDDEEGRNGDQQSPVQLSSLQGAFEFAPPTSLHQPYQGTAHCISCWTLGHPQQRPRDVEAG